MAESVISQPEQARWPSAIYPRFVGKWVLVTGASGGFGSAIAERAAAEGANVIVHYNSSASAAERTASVVRGYGREAAVMRADIRDWGQVKELAIEAFSLTGGLDVLVNNVGDIATDQMSWRNIDESVIDRVLAVDIKGTMLMIHEFGLRMLDQGHGSIVNIGSTVVVRGSPRAPQYAAGKYGMLGLTKSYAAAFAPTVRVNAFAPGFMETAGTLEREDWNNGRRERVLSMTPMGRIPGPQELAAAALFLATDDASHMTGNYMMCDGGYSMIGA
ncbi:MAG TPA: SDR family oxidoreductase [Acidimicrobiales bacterium]|nr:SDR family oxidoreductase [Acidimicrobiales bacterium]